MKQFFYISFSLVSLLLTGFSFQTEPPEKLLSDSRNYLSNLNDFSARFSYRLESVQSKRVSYNGILKYMKGNYRLTLQEQDIFFDGNRHTVYMPNENQYKKLENNPSQSVGLVKFMTYVYSWPSQKKYLGEEVTKGVSRHKVELTMNDNAPYQKAILWMDKDNKLIMKVSFIDSKKTITTYEFTEVNMNIGLQKSDFIFDPNVYPGATEIDED